MLIDDLDAIRGRFLETLGIDNTLQLVMANAPAREIDESKIFSRFAISSGDCTPYLTGYYQTLGLAMLQIVVPDGLGTTDGYVIADRFADAFRDWRSDDNQTRAYKSSMSTQSNRDSFQINVWVYWSSIRAN